MFQNNIRLFFIILLSFLITTNELIGQNYDTFERIAVPILMAQSNRYVLKLKNDVRYQKNRIDISEFVIDERAAKHYAKILFSFRTNISKYDNFFANGLDLIDITRVNGGGFNHKMSAVVSDVVIIGTIVKRKYLRNSKTQFRSVYLIQVDELLGGSINNESILKLYIGSGKKASVAHDPTLNKGDKGIFYLRQIDALYTLDDTPIEISKRENRYGFTGSQFNRIKGNKIYHEYRIINKGIREIKKEISIIHKINDVDNFCHNYK